MHLKTALLILAGASMAAQAQDVPPTRLDSNTVMTAEQAAVRFALDSSRIRPGRMIVVNPMVVPTGGATIGEGLALRPVWTTDRLAAFLKVPARFRDSVVTCSSRTNMGPRCDLVGADAYVSSSEPRFDGGLATVTVTIEAQGTRGTLAQETLNVVMVNTGAGWKVMRLNRINPGS